VSLAGATPPTDIQVPFVTIQPSSGWAPLRLRELWNFRELLYFLTWAEVKIKYKQASLGVAWAVIQPVFTMIVFAIFFGRLAGIDAETGGIPYPIFAYSALVPWTFFATALSNGGNSLVRFQQVITKVYFPRLMVPTANVLSGVIDLGIAAVVLLVMMFYYGLVPGVEILTLPFFALLAVITAIGGAMWLSALNVEYRDVRYVIPFLVQFWLFSTPVAYPTSLVPEQWRVLYGLNPMVGVVEGFRWALFDGADPPGLMLIPSVLVALAITISGLYYFRRMERTFADVV
jgi:lipopolysaccharide transport system permease protein